MHIEGRYIVHVLGTAHTARIVSVISLHLHRRRAVEVHESTQAMMYSLSVLRHAPCQRQFA